MTNPRGVHLVGSVPLDSAEEVFREASAVLGDRLRRVPDGETGPRALWISYQLERLLAHDAFEQGPAAIPGTPPTVRLREGVDPMTVDFGDLGYAGVLVESFQLFDRLQSEGTIPAGVKFLAAMPTPLANIWAWLGQDPHVAQLAPRYEQAMHGEVQRILEAIPHDRLCVQWDVCVEVWINEGWVPYPVPDPKQSVIDHVGRVSGWIPGDVELGYHFCYGDWQHEHLQQPEDTANLVALINGILAGVDRPVAYVHIPVPIERDDEAYFAPLRELALPAETEVYLGLVHMRDGEAGARRRIATAQSVISEFGVATECGMARRPPERGGAKNTLHELLELHAAVSDPVR